MRNRFLKFWEKSKDFSQLSFGQKIFFYILYGFEFFYNIFFYLVNFCKLNFFKKYKCKFKVISIGNISVGGTGKSVLTQFIIKNLKNLSGAIALRGYGGQNETKKDSFLVSDGKNIFCKSSYSGDEAFMHATSCKAPVVVGADRTRSCKLLENNFSNLDYVILDDAYQNHKVKKDLEILLLDAKYPFDNGHCLPAGKLREKDISRADLIILTHADGVSEKHLLDTKKRLSNFFDYNKIFTSKHDFSYLAKASDFSKIDYSDKNFLVFAGIASFNYFVKDLKNLNIKIFDSIEYPDHYKYTENDLNYILKYVKEKNLDGAITTQKDWSKLSNLVNSSNILNDLPIYISNIEFKFLTEKENEEFFKNLENIF